MVKIFCLLIALSSAYTLVTCANNTTVIQKCCPLDKELHFTEDGPICQALSEEESNHTSNFWWWLPKELIDANLGAEDLLNENKIEYKIPDCHIWAMEMLRFIMDNETDFEFHVEDGELRLTVLLESSYHDYDATRNDSFPPHTYCADRQGGLLTVLACPCLVHTCVRDCCGEGQVFNKTEMACVLSEHDEVNGRSLPEKWIPRHDNYTDYYKLTNKLPVCDNGYTSHEILNPSNESQLLLLKDGSMKAMDGSMEHKAKDTYCATYNADHREEMFFCLTVSMEHTLRRNIYGVMFLIGAFCLFLTVVITLLLPEMRRNIHGKMAVAHNFMLCVGHLVTGISQIMNNTSSQAGCKTTSLLIQFTILAAFFWLNVMCVDISWTFRQVFGSGRRPIKGTAMQRDRKKFIYYSFYAWGSTALISMATLIAEFSGGESKFKPNFGTQMCFFNNRGAELLFFFGPMALILAINLVLFTYTAYKIISVKRETSILKSGDSSTSTKNKQTLILYLKLFFLMGVTWVTEVLSWAIGGPSYLWYFTDAVNLLRAVFIFVIFCCKRAVYVMLQNRIRHCLGKEPLVRSGTSRGHHSSSSQTRNTGVSSITPSMKRKYSTQSTDSKIEGIEMSRIPRKSKDSIHDGNSKQVSSKLLPENK